MEQSSVDNGMLDDVWKVSLGIVQSSPPLKYLTSEVGDKIRARL